jgi:hypothetical protein
MRKDTPMRSIVIGCRWAGAAGYLGLALLLPGLFGCGGGEGKVSGQVLFNGEPLPGGRVTFRPANPRENSVSADLDEQGNYTAVLPVGEVQVCIDNRELEERPALGGTLGANLPLSEEVRKKLGRGQAPPAAPKSAEVGPKKSPARYVAIPSRYYTVEESGLQFTVSRGDQKHDIELTP